MITEKTKKTALNGEFVNLAEFLPQRDYDISNEYEIEAVVEDASNGLKFRPRKQKRIVNSFRHWLHAWNNYEDLLMSERPELYKVLSGYRRHIQACDDKYIWAAVMQYDCQFRSHLGAQCSFAFDQLCLDVRLAHLDATAVKNLTRCLRCRSLDHRIQECPFRATGALATPPKEKEVCKNFNEGKCNFQWCKRRHVCSGCGSAEPRGQCIKCKSA